MKSVSIDQGGVDLPALLAEIERNSETIVFFRDGKPIAHLLPHKAARKNRLKPHPELSRIKLHYDPTDPLDETDWPEEA